MTELLGMSEAELRSLAVSLGEPAYRGSQLYHALYAERRADVSEISNLPAALRERLKGCASISLPRLLRQYRSSDGTVRYLFALGSARPTNIETVYMPEENRQTICVSTQAGCAVDCKFCLTATLGLIRNLSPGEILGQVLAVLEAHRDELRPQTNVVLMGQGEPLLNYDAVLAALRTLSTSGIVPGIERLGQEAVRPKLAISLNASTDEQRNQIMPINRKYPLRMLLQACRRYPLRNWEKLTFEYVLLGGFNDAPEDARRVARLLNGLRCKVNLIPWNAGALPFRAPEPRQVEEFQQALKAKGVPAFVRYSRGQDVMAACGQLALIESAPAPANQPAQ
jgi:23S rRNA (adenine2503-C2)-methyltransferase